MEKKYKTEIVIRCLIIINKFRAYYLKKRDEGMKHKKAMIAFCNKLVRILHAMLTKREVFHMPEPS